MIKKSNLVKEARRRLQELLDIRSVISKELEKAPEGSLSIKKSGNRTQFYLRENAKDKTGIYVHVDNKTLLRTYVNKSYNSKIVKLVDKEIRNLEIYLEKEGENYKLIQELYSHFPASVRAWLKPVDMTDEEYIENWKRFEYKTVLGYEIKGEYITENGERVRSKSELNIANALFKYGIPYRYECPLQLKNGSVIYPDFTILDVKKRQNVYWEHRGMMDDREYAKHAVQKIKEYVDNNIYLWDNLIITEETLSSPLGTREIKKIIGKRFL